MTMELLFALIAPAILAAIPAFEYGIHHIESYKRAVKAKELLHAGYTVRRNKLGRRIYVAPDGDERDSIEDAYVRMMKVREIKEWNLPEPKELEAHSWR